MASEIGKTVIGKVIKTDALWKAAKICVTRMVLDVNTNVFVNKSTEWWASDPDLKTREGDIVTIKPYTRKPRVQITHYLKEIIFPVGNLVEPITGKRCRGNEYIDLNHRNLK